MTTNLPSLSEYTLSKHLKKLGSGMKARERLKVRKLMSKLTNKQVIPLYGWPFCLKKQTEIVISLEREPQISWSLEEAFKDALILYYILQCILPSKTVDCLLHLITGDLKKAKEGVPFSRDDMKDLLKDVLEEIEKRRLFE